MAIFYYFVNISLKVDVSKTKMLQFFVEKPHNPLINAGALVTISFMLTSIRRELALSDKFEFIKDFFKVKFLKEIA